MGQVVDFLRAFVWFWFVYGAVGRYVHDDGNSESTMEDNSRKIEEIMTRMDMLTNELKLLKDESGVQHNPVTSFPPAVFAPVTASREVKAGLVEYHVVYSKARGEPISVVWNTDNRDGFVRETDVCDGTQDTAVVYCTTTYVTSRINESTNFLLLSNDEIWYDVVLMGQGLDNQTVDIELPAKIELVPKRDLPYEIGQNVSFTINSLKDPSNKNKLKDFKFRMVKLDQGSDKVQLTSGRQLVNLIMSTYDKKEYFDYIEERFVVNTAHHNTSGVIYVVSDIDMGGPHGFEEGSGDSLLSYVSVSQVGFLLHPSSQPGPFPAGFVDFMQFEAMDSDGLETQVCPMNLPTCDVLCGIYGSNLASVVLSTVNIDGNSEVDKSETGLDFSTFVSHKVATNQLTPGEVTHYQCHVTSHDGVTSVRNIQLLPYVEATFREDESSFVVTPESATFICTVVGNPLPNITFNMEFYSGIISDAQPDEVAIEGNRLMATLTLHVNADRPDPYDRHGTHQRVPEQGFRLPVYSAACKSDQYLGEIGTWPYGWEGPLKKTHYYNVYE